MKNLPHLASRLFNTPLMVEQGKLEVILDVFMKKLDGVQMASLESGDQDKTRRNRRYSVKAGVAIIPVWGTLVNRGLTFGPESGMTSYEYIQTAVETAMQDEDVKSILFDVDSPGGEADGAFDLSDFIYAQRGKKKMVAMADGMAASAAYAIASAADQVYSTRTAVTGSVGVIAVHMDKSGENEKKGINVTIVRQGTKKAALNPFEPLTQDASDKLNAEVSGLYDEFVNLVARNRGISAEAVKETESDTYTGVKAQNVGFIDGVITRGKLGEILSERKGVASATNTTLTSTTKETDMSEKEEASKQADASQNLDSARNEGRAQATEIVQLCALAGCPEKAGEFLASNMSTAQIREKLLTEQAQSDKNTHVDTQEPSSGYNASNNPLLAAAKKIAEARKQSIQ